MVVLDFFYKTCYISKDNWNFLLYKTYKNVGPPMPLILFIIILFIKTTLLNIIKINELYALQTFALQKFMTILFVDWFFYEKK